MNRSRRGTAAVEFALCLPITVLLAAGIVDLGRAISFRHTLQRAARDAARVGSAITTTTDNLPAEEGDIEAAAVEHAMAAMESSIPDCDSLCEADATWFTGPDDNEYLAVVVRGPQAEVFGVVPGLGGILTNRFTVMTRKQE